MSLYMSDDPARDAERYMMAQDILLERRPKCQCCGRHIQDDEGLHFVDEAIDLWLCQDCIEANMEYIEVD